MNNKKNQSIFRSHKKYGVLGFLIPLVIVFTSGMMLRFLTTEAEAFAENPPSMEFETALSPTVGDNATIIAGDEITTYSSEVVHDIAFQARNFRFATDKKNEGNIVIDLCYDLLEDREWSITSSTLYDAQGHQAQLTEMALLDVHLPPVMVDGKSVQEVLNFRGTGEERYYIDAKNNDNKGQICLAAIYIPQPGFDVSKFRIIIDALIRYPYENEECNPEYQKNVQKALDDRGTNIKIKVVKETVRVETTEGEYVETEVCRFDVSEKPKNLSAEEARTIINELLLLRGPWIIDVNTN